MQNVERGAAGLKPRRYDREQRATERSASCARKPSTWGSLTVATLLYSLGAGRAWQRG